MICGLGGGSQGGAGPLSLVFVLMRRTAIRPLYPISPLFGTVPAVVRGGIGTLAVLMHEVAPQPLGRESGEPLAQ